MLTSRSSPRPRTPFAALATVTVALAAATPACECDTISPEDNGLSGEPSMTTSTASSTASTAAPPGEPTGGPTEGATAESSGGATGSSTGGSTGTSGVTTTTSGTTADTGPDIPELCGNDQVEPGEQCDDGPANADNLSCTEQCTLNVCGDSFHWEGMEECDNGGESESCNADCTLAECKDGVVNLAAGETCDDANDTPLDGCENDCKKTRLTGVFAASERTCVLLEDAHLKCWGENGRGQLGYGHLDTIGDNELAGR